MDVTSERLHPFEEREVNIVTAGRIGKSELQKKTKILFLRTKSCFVTIDNAFKTISSNHQLEKTNL